MLASGARTSDVKYSDQGHQIDEGTYFVTYANYLNIARSQEQQINPRDDKWIKVAQEYVLYRAAELAKSKGTNYFAVLYQDDWNVLNTWSPQHDVQPGAGLVIRLFNSYPSEIPTGDGRVYEVEILLQTLTEINRGLAEYAKKPLPDDSGNKNGSDFRRWRKSVNQERVKLASEFGASARSRITQDQMGNFQIMTWEDRFGPVSPIQFWRFRVSHG
jgi:hypothetical protein